MEQAPLFLTPVFQERIWGGTALRDRFGYALHADRIGECWGISAHPHGPSRIRNGPYQGQLLAEVWRHSPELFGQAGQPCAQAAFPLLVKLLDCNADLSVQVHPDDAYAEAHANGERGKTECWYVLACVPDAEIVLGHRAQTREELAERIRRGEWEQLLVRRAIRPGDFIYVPSGTVHALCRGTLVLEIQQSSDTTYRLYDYDRLDADGNKRPLHVRQALDVITVPHVEPHVQERLLQDDACARLLQRVESAYFAVYQLQVRSAYHGRTHGRCWLASVIAGAGRLTTAEGEWSLQCGDHLILPATLAAFTIAGSLELMLARP